MKYSVLLSVYKKEQPVFFQQSLDSIFNQTLLPDEIVLVKDGPLTDDLERIIANFSIRFSRLKVITLSTNQGLGKALNEGLSHCTFELLPKKPEAPVKRRFILDNSTII